MLRLNDGIWAKLRGRSAILVAPVGYVWMAILRSLNLKKTGRLVQSREVLNPIVARINWRLSFDGMANAGEQRPTIFTGCRFQRTTKDRDKLFILSQGQLRWGGRCGLPNPGYDSAMSFGLSCRHRTGVRVIKAIQVKEG